MEKNKLNTLRHSLSHLLGAAVLEISPEAKLGIGPAIENGFYYDFDLPKNITPEDLPKIEKRMRDLISQDIPFQEEEVSKKEAIDTLKKSNQIYKIELVNDLPGESVTFYKTGDFIDLCKGPHIASSGKLKDIAWKLDKTAGAYWRGDEKNKMLQRIYGLVFENQSELDEFIKNREEAEKRDHRKIGKDLGLFVFSDLVGPGLPLYTQKGTILRNIIADYSRQLRKEIGYSEVQTPQINKADLFKVSGHYDKYKDDMFEVHSHYTDEEYYLKPMNCPQHTQIFASKMYSYKDMPVRIADFSMLYRDEKPGELSGLTRLRAFSQDDGHCFCRVDQIKEEFSNILKIIEKAMKRYGMNYYIRLSLRNENKKEAYLGDSEVWEKSQEILEEIIKENKVEYVRAEGEAAFYGPKMDLMAKDSLGREWQLSTIQIDFNMPKRFNLEYTAEDGSKQTPVMIHSAIVGSPERFMGVLIEHFTGAFPVWLAPVQAIILPVSEKHNEFAQKITDELTSKGVRTEIDLRNESVGRKIRDAEMQKTPFAIVLGDKEIESNKLSVRIRGGKELILLSIDEFVKTVQKNK